MKRWIYGVAAAGLVVVPLALAHAGGDGPHKGMGHCAGQSFGSGAGHGPGPGHRMMFRHGKEGMPSIVDHLAKALDLTDDQKSSAKEIESRMKAAVEPIHADMKRIHEEMDQALTSNALAATVGALAIEAYQIHKKAEATHEEFHAQFQEILTAEQREKFEKFRTEMHGGPHGGPHGFPPPGK